MSTTLQNPVIHVAPVTVKSQQERIDAFIANYKAEDKKFQAFWASVGREFEKGVSQDHPRANEISDVYNEYDQLQDRVLEDFYDAIDYAVGENYAYPQGYADLPDIRLFEHYANEMRDLVAKKKALMQPLVKAARR